MSVTVEQVEAVANKLRQDGQAGLASEIDDYANVLRSKDSPDVAVATAIRNAYYNDGVHRDLFTSRDPDQWLRMAKAAKGDAPVPRVFNVGDPEPEDRDTITLVSDRSYRRWGVPLTIKYGNYGTYGDRTDWWQMCTANSTYDSWNNWLAYYGPLTEVMD